MFFLAIFQLIFLTHGVTITNDRLLMNWELNILEQFERYLWNQVKMNERNCMLGVHFSHDKDPSTLSRIILTTRRITQGSMFTTLN
jgi:hypothetical protein